MKHVCHHCGVQGHTRPNCFKLHALKKVDSMCGQEGSKRRPKGDSEGHLIRDVIEMLKNISLCLASFTLRFESYCKVEFIQSLVGFIPCQICL